MSVFSDKSHWIWLPGQPEVNCYLQFRHVFSTAFSHPATLYISAEGLYAAFINGEYLPSTQYPDTPAAKAVQSVPIALPAEKTSAVLDIHVYYPGIATSISRVETPGLRFELRQDDALLCASGADTLVRPLPGYQGGPVPMINRHMGFGFQYSGPVQLPWEAACPAQKSCQTELRPISELVLFPEKPVRIYSQGVFQKHCSGQQQYAALSFREWETLAGTQVKLLPARDGILLSSQEGDGIYLVIDLGEETTGYLTLDMVCPEAAAVEIGFGEHLEDLRVRTDVDGNHFTLRWEAPCQRQPFIHRFHRTAGRYLQLFVYAKAVTVYKINLIPVMYPVRQDSTFSCSDKLHERIYQTAKYTLRNCLHEHYEDCPWREQALYAFDSRNQMLFGYYAFGEFRQPRANLKMLARSLRSDGLLELCAPTSKALNIPGFSLVFILALEEYSRFSGDLSLAKELTGTVHQILKTFHNRLQDGKMGNFREIPYWNFYDWQPLLDGTPIVKETPSDPSWDAVLQLYYILALQRTMRLHQYLDLGEIPFSADLAAATDAMELYWSEDHSAYASFLRDGQKVQYAELTQALALYTGICPKHREDVLRAHLASGTLVPVSLSASIFKYEALLQDGEKYGAHVINEIASRWGSMLYRGASTLWETDLGAEDFNRAGSLCHAWSSVPVYIYGAYVLGVRADTPGVWIQHPGIPSPILRAEGRLYPPSGSMDVSAQTCFP